MKVFLFMYPINQFFDEVPRDLSFSFDSTYGCLKHDDLYKIEEMINARYRQQGYEIVWVFYGVHGQKHLPDVSDLSRHINVQDGDLLVSSGSYKGEPNFEFILGQIPDGIEELVVGGFHWLSCVAFMADYAIEAEGLNCTIDEDTTQAYFAKLALMRRQLGRDPILEGEICQPWQIAGLLSEQKYYCQGLILKPWIVRYPPTDQFTFRFDGDKLETFSRAEVEEHFAKQRAG